MHKYTKDKNIILDVFLLEKEWFLLLLKYFFLFVKIEALCWISATVISCSRRDRMFFYAISTFTRFCFVFKMNDHIPLHIVYVGVGTLNDLCLWFHQHTECWVILWKWTNSFLNIYLISRVIEPLIHFMNKNIFLILWDRGCLSHNTIYPFIISIWVGMIEY